MQHELIVGYRLLSNTIAEKYGIGNQLRLYSEHNLIHVTKAFNRELSINALLWLETMLDRESHVQVALVEQVNVINKQQRERFSLYCRASKILNEPCNVISLN